VALEDLVELRVRLGVEVELVLEAATAAADDADAQVQLLDGRLGRDAATVAVDPGRFRLQGFLHDPLDRFRRFFRQIDVSHRAQFLPCEQNELAIDNPGVNGRGPVCLYSHYSRTRVPR